MSVPGYGVPWAQLTEPRESWYTSFLSCFSALPASIARWPPRHVLALTAELALAYCAVQLLGAREALGPMLTLVGFLAVTVLIGGLGVIALYDHEKRSQRPKEPPHP
jgi:hypothetical protein